MTRFLSRAVGGALAWAVLGKGPAVWATALAEDAGSDARPAANAPDNQGVVPPKRVERELPAQPVTSTAFSYPYVYSERFAASGDVPATALLKVQDRGVTAYVRAAKGDDSVSGGTADTVTKTSRIAYGVTPAFHLKGGVRLAFGLDSEQWEANNGLGGVQSGHSKQSWDLTTLALQAALRVQGPWAVGLKYSSSRLGLTGDLRGAGGALTRDDERFADIRPSVAFIRAAYEVHAEFLAKVQYAAGPAEFARPATTAVHVRRTLAPGRLLYGDASYGLWSATGDGRKSAPALHGGFVSSQARWGDVGGGGGYRAPHYANAGAAAPDTIGRFEASLFADIRPDRDTHYALSIDGALGQDRGVGPDGSGTSVKTQEVTYQMAFARLF